MADRLTSLNYKNPKSVMEKKNTDFPINLIFKRHFFSLKLKLLFVRHLLIIYWVIKEICKLLLIQKLQSRCIKWQRKKQQLPNCFGDYCPLFLLFFILSLGGGAERINRKFAPFLNCGPKGPNDIMQRAIHGPRDSLWKLIQQSKAAALKLLDR